MHKTLRSISKDLVLTKRVLIHSVSKVESVALVSLHYSQVNIRGSRIIAGHFFWGHKEKRATNFNMSNKIKTMYNLNSTHSLLSSILVHTLIVEMNTTLFVKTQNDKKFEVWMCYTSHCLLGVPVSSTWNMMHGTLHSFSICQLFQPLEILISNVKKLFNLSCFTMSLITWWSWIVFLPCIFLQQFVINNRGYLKS